MTHGTPIWQAFGETNVAEPSRYHHRRDLGTRHSVFKARAETVERIGSHAVVAAPVVGAQRPFGDVEAKPFGKLGGTRQRPIDNSGRRIGDGCLEPEWCFRDGTSQKIARAPKRAEPPGLIVERLVDVNEHRRAWLEFFYASGETSGRVRQVVQHAEAIAEVHAVVG